MCPQGVSVAFVGGQKQMGQQYDDRGWLSGWAALDEPALGCDGRTAVVLVIVDAEDTDGCESSELCVELRDCVVSVSCVKGGVGTGESGICCEGSYNVDCVGGGDEDEMAMTSCSDAGVR